MFFIIIIIIIIILGSGINPVSDLGPRAGYNAPGYEQFRRKLPKQNKVTSLQLKSLWGNHPVGHEGTNLQKKKVISYNQMPLSNSCCPPIQPHIFLS